MCALRFGDLFFKVQLAALVLFPGTLVVRSCGRPKANEPLSL